MNRSGFYPEPKFELAKDQYLVLDDHPGMTFKAYMDNAQAKTGKTPEDFWKLARKKGFVKQGLIVAKHADLLTWLKSEIGLGHVHANFVMLYLRLRTNDPKVSAQSKKWAYTTGYQEPK